LSVDKLVATKLREGKTKFFPIKPIRKKRQSKITNDKLFDTYLHKTNDCARPYEKLANISATPCLGVTFLGGEAGIFPLGIRDSLSGLTGCRFFIFSHHIRWSVS